SLRKTDRPRPEFYRPTTGSTSSRPRCCRHCCGEAINVSRIAVPRETLLCMGLFSRLFRTPPPLAPEPPAKGSSAPLLRKPGPPGDRSIAIEQDHIQLDRFSADHLSGGAERQLGDSIAERNPCRLR